MLSLKNMESIFLIYLIYLNLLTDKFEIKCS